MIKICHMTSAHSSTDTRIFYKQCTSLSKAGYDVCLVAQGESYESNGIKIVGVPRINGGRLNRMTKVAKSVYKKALETDADIYQIHDPELLRYALKLKKKNKTVIFDSHEDFMVILLEKSYIPAIFRPVLNLFFNSYYRVVLKKFDAIITVTPHIYDKIKRVNRNTFMITNYPIIHNYSEEREYVFNNRIVFAGAIVKDWCHHTIINSLEKCINVRYILFGSGNEKYINELKTLTKWEFVDYLGKIPYTDVSEKLKDGSIGMAVAAYSRGAAYKIGSLGNQKIFEYMAEGLPIICTDFILWKEIIDKYKCGICVNPYNSDEIADAINYLLKNPEISKEMGENGRQAILKDFNWGIEEQKLLTLYKSLV